MLHILLGPRLEDKKKFVDSLKSSLSGGLLGVETEILYGKDVTSLDALEQAVRSLGLGGQRLVVLWDVDSLKSSLFNGLVDLINRFALDSSGVCLVVEGGSEPDGRNSRRLAELFPKAVRTFGTVSEENMFDLVDLMMSGNLEGALSLFDRLKIDRWTFSGLVGALRYRIEDRFRQDPKRRLTLLEKLAEVDIAVKMYGEDPRDRLIYLTLGLRRQ